MKKLLFVFIICLSMSPTEGAENKKMNIAVSDLNGQGVDASSTAIISDRLRTELFKQGGFTVLERNAMQDILKEQGFQQSGCTSDACAVEIGQLLGVSYIIVGTVGKLGHLFTIDIRMIEVSTARIAYSENVDCDCPIEKVLTGSVVSIAKKIAENVKSRSAAAAQPQETAGATSAPALDTSKAGAGKAAAAAAEGPKPKKSRVLTITLGAVTLAAAGAGVAFDNMLKGKIDDNAKLRAEYEAQPGNSQYADYATRVQDNNKSANTYQNLRNASYIVSGLGLVGFVISFWF